MSRTRNYKQDTLDIQKRYFETMALLAETKKFPGGLFGFLTTYGIDSRNWYSQRTNNGRGYFEVAWLVPLIRYYKVNANWLLLGTGKQFKGSSDAD